jgi:ATP-dependent 26S proteasome regulatory subunit
MQVALGPHMALHNRLVHAARTLHPPSEAHATHAVPTQVTPGARVALRNDSYTLHVLLPTKVDPLVSLMKVEKVPDSTYDMVGGLDQQIKEIKEVCF